MRSSASIVATHVARQSADVVNDVDDDDDRHSSSETANA
jgi:hypothetical protein